MTEHTTGISHRPYRLNFSTVSDALDEIPESADVIEVTQASYERMQRADAIDFIPSTPPVPTFLGRRVKVVSGPAVRFQRLPNGDGLPVPAYQTALAAGMDLPAAESTVIDPGEIVVVSCGFNVAISEGYEGSVRPRSGLARKHGISIVNSPGTIDADYRGEICCILVNHGKQPFAITKGDRIAQMVISPVAHAEISEVKTLDDTLRGAGGFGSTGV